MSGPGDKRSGRRTRQVIGGLLAVQIGLALAGLMVWAWLPGAPPPPGSVPGPASGAAVSALPGSIESASPVAGAAAGAWLPDARLMHAAIQIDWPWEAPPPGETEPIAATGWIDYVYAAPWSGPGQPAGGGATLSLLVERLSGAIVVQSSTAWATMPTRSGEPPAGAITSLEAVAAAEAAAGAGFRHACPIYRHVTRLSLVTPEQEPAHWLVAYEDTRQRDRHGLVITVDAETGAATVTGGTAPEC